jgi:hypothetical protein
VKAPSTMDEDPRSRDMEVLGLAIVLQSLTRLATAQLGRCEASDNDILHPMRCTSTGVRIWSTASPSPDRLRVVCPKHGYDPRYTPPR